MVEASYCERLDDLLRRSDFVMLAVKLTPDTTGLIGRRELSLMKPTATLVNISRGGSDRVACIIIQSEKKQLYLCRFSGQVVDQDALVEALQTGRLRAAALDVTYPEPLPRSGRK